MIITVLLCATSSRTEDGDMLTPVKGKFPDGTSRGNTDLYQVRAVLEGVDTDLLTAVRLFSRITIGRIKKLMEMSGEGASLISTEQFVSIRAKFSLLLKTLLDFAQNFQ